MSAYEPTAPFSRPENHGNDSYDPFRAQHPDPFSYGNAQPAPAAGAMAVGAFGQKAARPRFFKTRRRMCLCLCCGVLLLLAAILIPVTIFVVVPAVAQAAIDASEMVLSSSNITAPNEDGFTMKMAGMISKTGPFDASIEMNGPLKVMVDGAVLGEVEMPPIQAKGGVGAVLDVTSFFRVTNKTAFGDFSRVMMAKESFTWTLDGEVNIHAFGFTLPSVKMVKSVPLKGMNNFPNVEIRGFDLPANDPRGGVAVTITAAMNNPSPIGMEAGDMSFDVVYNDTKVGEVEATNVNLVPGMNVLNLKGRMIPLNTTRELDMMSDMMSRYMAGETAIVGCVGTMIRPNNRTAPISWLLAGFKGTKMLTPFPGAKDLKIVTKVDIGSMGIKFTPETALSPVTSGKDIAAFFKMPFAFPLSMREITQNITMSYGSDMAVVRIPWSPAVGESASGKMVTAFDNAVMQVMPGKEQLFAQFVLELSQSQSRNVQLKVEANAKTQCAIGLLTVRGMKFNDTIPLQGMNGFRGVPIKILSMVVRPGTSEYLPIDLTISMTNPANVGIEMGEVRLDAYYQQQKIGWAVIPEMKVGIGESQLKNTFYFSPQGAAAQAAGRKMLSDYMIGGTAQVGIAGHRDSTQISTLVPTMEAMRIETSMPGLQGVQVMRQARFGVDAKSLLTLHAQASFDAFNPLDAPIKFLGVDARMYYKGKEALHMVQDLSANPMVLSPKSVTSSPIFSVRPKIDLTSFKLLFSALKNELYVDVVGTATAAIGDYVITLDIQQNGLQTVLSL